MTLSATVAVIVGGFEMVAGYFIYEQLVLGSPLAVAAAVKSHSYAVQMAYRSSMVAVPSNAWRSKAFSHSLKARMDRR